MNAPVRPDCGVPLRLLNHNTPDLLDTALRDILREHAAVESLMETISSEITKAVASGVCIVTATGSRITALKESVTDLKELRKQFMEIGVEIGAVEAAIKKFGNVCPHCGQVLQK